jgi:hypothetical protein
VVARANPSPAGRREGQPRSHWTADDASRCAVSSSDDRASFRGALLPGKAVAAPAGADQGVRAGDGGWGLRRVARQRGTGRARRRGSRMGTPRRPGARLELGGAGRDGAAEDEAPRAGLARHQ